MSQDLRKQAARLAKSARDGDLVLFLGAGVSTCAGLPSWNRLITILAQKAEILSDGEASDKDFEKLSLLDRARLIADRLNEKGVHVGEEIKELFKGCTHHSLIQTILAALPVKEVVTTNYDTLFEQASEYAQGSRLRVIPYQPPVPGHRWLLKRSEIFRLIWTDDVNFEKRQIRLGTRKTRDGSMSYEWLPTTETLYASLMWLYQNRKFPDSPFLFVCERPGPREGKPFTTRRKFLRGLCKRAGVRPFGFHALRHFTVSILADKHKVSTKHIQRILGHRSVHTTERYLERLHGDLAATLELLDYSAEPEMVKQAERDKEYPHEYPQ